jgi:hypothetical protein
MKKATITSIFYILTLIWPFLPVKANHCCGGGARNVDLGGNIQRFEVPAVDKIVKVDGFTLKVNRVKWSIYTIPIGISQVGRPIAVLKDKNTTICVRRVAPNATLQRMASSFSPSSELRVEKVRTTFAVKGVKVIYCEKPNFLSQNIESVLYYFQEKSGRILCFEVYPTGKFANWADANNLILNTLQYRTSV